MVQEKILLRPIRRSPAIVQREIEMVKNRFKRATTDKERSHCERWLKSLEKELEDV